MTGGSTGTARDEGEGEGGNAQGKGNLTSGGGPVASASMAELEAMVKVCQLCRLAHTRTNAVPGEGNPHAEVMFIGEGPGYHEDRQGRPFVGPAGQFLNELLGIAGLSRRQVFIANVVKCRPPNNRDPMPDEIAACAPYLERQIELVNPKVIVTLGRYSMARFFPGERISQIHGKARLVEGRMCVAMYHPAAGLHQASLADVIRADFRKLPVYIEQARAMLSEEAPGLPASAPTRQVGAPVGTTAGYETDRAGQMGQQSEGQVATAGATESGHGAEAKAKKDKGENGDGAYRQLSLFDI